MEESMSAKHWQLIAEKLFLKFEAIYPRTWTSSFSSPESLLSAKHEWGDFLASIPWLNLEIMKKAVLHVRENCEWPPSMAEFKTICKSCRDNGLDYTQKYLEDHRERKVADKTVAKATLEAIRKRLGSTPSNPSGVPKDNDEDELIYNPLSRLYDPIAFANRRKRLVETSEEAAIFLPISEQYDRIRYWHQDEWQRKYGGQARSGTDPPADKNTMKGRYGRR